MLNVSPNITLYIPPDTFLPHINGPKLWKIESLVDWIHQYANPEFPIFICGSRHSSNVAGLAQKISQKQIFKTCAVLWESYSKEIPHEISNFVDMVEWTPYLAFPQIESQHLTTSPLYKIPPSNIIPEGSFHIGAISGILNWAKRLEKDILQSSNFDTLVFDAGTGLYSVISSLYLSKRLPNLQFLIYSMYFSPQNFYEKAFQPAYSLYSEFLCNSSISVDAEDFIKSNRFFIRNPFVGKSFGSRPQVINSFTKEFKTKHSVQLCPLYSSKVLYDLLENKKYQLNEFEQYLVVHSGINYK